MYMSHVFIVERLKSTGMIFFYVSLMLVSLYIQYTTDNTLRSITIGNISIYTGQLV